MLAARRCIGEGRGGVFSRVRNFFSVVSGVTVWLLDGLGRTADSMKSRGYTLKGRTAFSIYRFDNRDRGFVTGLCWCVVIVLMGAFLDQTNILYAPEIVMNGITPLSAVFYAAYALLCLLPLLLQISGETGYRRRIMKI